jgi:hypothetical protein
LEGKVNVSGKIEKRGPGFMIGELGYFGILQKHPFSITGESEGIVLALRIEDIHKMSNDIKNIISLIVIKESLELLSNPEQGEPI